MKNDEILIVIASGKNNPQKAILGFAWALSAISSNIKVTIFLTMDGAIWSDEDEGNEIVQDGFETIDTYWNLLSELGANFEGCSSCIKNYCNTKDSDHCNLRPNMKESGLSSAAIKSSTMQTILF